MNTEPSGAAVRTTNQFACDATPCTFKMARKSEFDVTITKPGYKPWTGHVTHHVSGAGGAGMAGNVLLGGIIGAGVDAYSGAMNDLVPNPLTVKLEKEEQHADAKGSQ
ncbi:MAG: PEGA domain-containing protein [Phenylobacterium sp.]